MDKGIDPIITPEKQVIKPLIMHETCISPETKGTSQVKQRLCQSRAGIKRKTIEKPEQPKLLPGRKPIIQIAERPIQSKTRLKVSE